jgi:hypothetical protein
MPQLIDLLPFKEALSKLQGRQAVPSALTSADWMQVPVALREKALFSARVSNASFLSEMGKVVDEVLRPRTVTREDGTVATEGMNPATARLRLKEKLDELGYHPATEDAGTIKDLRSDQRLDLIVRTNAEMQQGYGQWLQGQASGVLEAWPAQELYRAESRAEPRDWQVRWNGARGELGSATSAIDGRIAMVALKDDPIWTAISAFGTPWPPYDFNSGMWTRDVDRDRALELGVLKEGQKVGRPQERFEGELRASVREVAPELLASLKQSLGDQVMVKGDAIWLKGDRAGKALAGQTVKRLPKLRLDAHGFPTQVTGLEDVKGLGGSTGARLVKEPGSGALFVRKEGASAEHLREEAAADRIYQAAGLNVPEARVFDLPTGQPVKLAKFVEGQQLQAWLKQATPAQKEGMVQEIRKGFAVDAWLGNWDVAGMGMDNLLVDGRGKAWRIDNGGSLRYRAQGARKVAFGPGVPELDAMRDPSKNPSAAELFGGLNDQDLVGQIRDLDKKRKAVLDAAPEDLREVLGQRLDDMLGWAKAREKKRMAVESPELGEAVAKSRILGKSHLGDKDGIEDLQVLFYTERRAGQDYTVARFKLTPTGGQAVRQVMGQQLQTIAPSAKADPYWDSLLAGIKTVNGHQGDGQYNTTTLAKVAAVKQQLEGLGADQAAVKQYYLGIVQEIQGAHAAKAATRAGLKAFTPPAAAAKPDALTNWQLKTETWVMPKKERRRAVADVSNDPVHQVTNSVLGRHANGVELKMVPPDSAAPYALRGTVELAVPGKGGEASLAKVAQAARDLGVPVDDAAPERQELTYLARNLGLMERELTKNQVASWKNLAAMNVEDGEKVKRLKDWVGKTLKVDVANPAVFKPAGDQNSFGFGFRRWDRFDLPRAKVEQELKDYTLHHNMAGDLPKVVESWLDGGGQVTNTTERLRVGVPISDGMSPDADLQTGGASYFFTRIQEKTKASKGVGVTFKIGNLSRVDAWSFKTDVYGDIRPAGQNSHMADPVKARGVTVDQFKEHATHSSNETIFKNGFHLLDDLDEIVAKSTMERESVIKVFKQHGYHKLPDGRQIEKVVRVKL